MGGGGGPGGPDSRLLAHDVGFFTLVPKLDRLLDPPPLSKIMDPPLGENNGILVMGDGRLACRHQSHLHSMW